MERDRLHRIAGRAIFGCAFLMIFFSIPVTNILIFIYVINWLMGSSKRSWTWQKREWLLLLVISPWLLELVSVLYSSNVEIGIHQVEKRLTLVAFPIITLHSVSNAVNERAVVFRIAIICTLLVTLYCLLVATYNFFAHSVNLFYWEDFTRPIIFMPGYLSLIINILTIWIFSELITGWASYTPTQKLGYLILIVYFCIITILLASKLHSMIFIVIVIIGGSLIYRSHMANRRVVLLLVALLVAIGFVVPKSMIIERYARIDNFVRPDFGAPDEAFNELTLRLAIFECATYVIKENPFFGTGVGDVMNDLEAIYRKVGFKFGYNNSYDPHDQYLRICLGTGMVGLMLFLATLISVFITAVRSGDWMLAALMALFCSSFLFESVLERHNGIIIYAFIHSVVVFGKMPKGSLETSSKSKYWMSPVLS